MCIERLSFFIDGKWIDALGDDVAEVVSPHTEKVVGRVALATPAEIDRAVGAARRAFDEGPWPRLPLDERVRLVSALADRIAERGQQFAELISRQNGTPMKTAMLIQVMSAVAAYHSACAAVQRRPLEESRQGLLGPMLIRHEPVGVVAAIVPWNTPQAIIAPKLGSALVTGCSVVLKPSPECPLDSYLLAEIAEEIGLPAGVLNVVTADREVSAALVGHPGVDKVAFTGSVAAGKQIMQIAAGDLKRLTLELGGKSAAILLPDCDIDRALRALLAGAFPNSGQACAALTRILVPDDRSDEIAAKIVAAVEAMPVGDPADPATVIGPMVTARQRRRVLDYIDLGRAEGATVLTGGGVPASLPQGWYVEPTVLGDVDNTMRVAREEIFGPVICLIRYRDEEEAIRLANDSDFGLSGAVWSGDAEHGLEVARRIRTGTFSVNCVRLDLGGPFGGYKQSGIGREFGEEGLSAYLETKSISLPKH